MACNSVSKKKRRILYKAYCAIECLLVVALFFSVLLKCTCGLDIIGLPIGLKKAVEIVASTIGLGSILLVWLFAELDKIESGFKYSYLLRAVYPAYRFFVLAHLGAILSALFFAKLGWIASASISLALVIWGCGLQWKALSILIFRDEKRKAIAVDEWNRIISESERVSNDDTNQLIIIFSISDALSMQEIHHNPPLYDCFAHAMLVLTKQGGTLEQRIQRLASVWDRLLRTRQPNECPAILGDVFKRIGNMSKEYGSQALGVVCTSYVLWLSRHHSETSDHDTELDDIMVRIAVDVEFIAQRNPESEYSDIANYLKAAFAVQAWMHVLCGNTHFSYDLFLTSPSQALSEEDKTLLKSFIGCIFSGPGVEEHFQIAIAQVDASISNQKEPVTSGC